jgi:hypothetical protein
MVPAYNKRQTNDERETTLGSSIKETKTVHIQETLECDIVLVHLSHDA